VPTLTVYGDCEGVIVALGISVKGGLHNQKCSCSYICSHKLHD